jgi:hypothetical protein
MELANNFHSLDEDGKTSNRISSPYGIQTYIRAPFIFTASSSSLSKNITPCRPAHPYCLGLPPAELLLGAASYHSKQGKMGLKRGGLRQIMDE